MTINSGRRSWHADESGREPISRSANNRSTAAYRILIVGAGVSGISVARGLLRDGHDVTLFERRPDVGAGGGAVTLWPNGSTVLEQLGVDMEGAGQLVSTVRITTSTGRPLATIDVDSIVDRLGGRVRMVPRRGLLERLVQGFPVDRIRCNARATAVVSAADGVRIEFEDGSAAEGDVLIGADGLHSTVRNVIGAAPAKPTGWCSWQGLITLQNIAEKQEALQVIGEHGNVGLWPAGDAELQWWFDLPWSSRFVRPERPIDMIRSHFSGWSESIDRVLAALTDDDLARSPFPHYRHPIPRVPDHVAITLLGDAAHTMPPVLAQGTNQALLDTMVLCKALTDFRRKGANRSNGELSKALRWYEKTRRRRLTAVSWVTSRQMSQSESVLKPASMLSDSFSTWALTVFLRSLSHRRISAEIVREVRAAKTIPH